MNNEFMTWLVDETVRSFLLTKNHAIHHVLLGNRHFRGALKTSLKINTLGFYNLKK